MKLRRSDHFATPASLSAGFLLIAALLLQTSAAPMPSVGGLGRALTLRAAIAPKFGTAPALKTSASAHLAGYYRNSYPALVPGLSRQQGLSPYAQPRTPTSNYPVVLEPFSSTEVVGITDAAGHVVRAPGSMTNDAAAINEPTPNQALTFTVHVNSAEATTQATAVYIQFKDPNSLYQDISLNGNPQEHKVFTEDDLDNRNGLNSGSATFELYNGQGGQPTQKFTGNKIPNQTDIDRGAVGGTDTYGNITVGTVNLADQSPLNPITVKDGTNVHNLPGIDTSASIGNGGGFGAPSVEAKFHPWGQEYECQFIDPHDNGTSSPSDPSGYGTTSYTTTDTTPNDFGTPYYLAGYDDQQPGSFGVSGAAVVGVPANSTNGDKDWLKLTVEPGNPDYYQATWSPPASPSDYYMDVIVVDSAKNFRIYDNVWGFSTLPFSPVHDILFVADNVLGQKFAASAPNLDASGPVNLRPVFYGAESYFTDVDTSILPNATEYWIQAVGRTPTYMPPGSTANEFTTDQTPIELIQGLGFNFNFNNTFGNNTVHNGLGYDSYQDETTNREMVYPIPQQADSLGSSAPVAGSEQVLEPRSQAYSIWRILCRGRVPQSVYTDYSPGFVSQPAVDDPFTGFKAPAADGTASPLVTNATRCILWAAPFAGDEPLNVAGSITDPNVQTDLTAFVNAGGRLYVNGQEIASALTLNGIENNGPGSFIYDVLNAELKTTGKNSTTNQIITGSTGTGNRISFDAFFNWFDPFTFDSVYSDYFNDAPTGTDSVVFTYKSPADDSPLFIGNNFTDVRVNGVADNAQWRTDGALTQLGPVTTNIGNAVIQGKINSIIPENGDVTNFTNPDGSSLIYSNNYTSAMGSGYGSRVVFGSFGLEGIGSEYYQGNAANQDFFFPRNERRDILHNVVNYLRTGTFKGTIFEGSGSNVGVAGATVYLRPFRNVTIPGPRQTYSAITSDGTQTYTNGDQDGLAGQRIPVGGYEIDGVEPGVYQVFVYKTGFSESSSPIENNDAFPFSVSGDTTATVNLNIVPVPNGSISGTVTNSATGAVVAGATVTFTSSDGTVTQSTTTASNGTYSISLPSGTYTGVATQANPSASSPTSPTITVTSGQNTSGVNFQITINPGTITGIVTDGSGGPGVNGATVSFTASGATSPAATVTTSTINGVAGSYTSPGLPVGTYTLSASKTGFFATNAPTVTVTAGSSVTAPTIVLAAAVNVTLNVTVLSGTTPITNATVSLADLSGNHVATLTASNGSDVYSGTVLQGSYVATVTATAYQTVTQNVTVSANPTNVTVQLSAATAAFTFPGGTFSMISWPYNYMPSGSSAFDNIFGSLFSTTSGTGTGNRSRAFSYDAAINNYITDPGFPADGLRPGYGYFIYLKQPVSVYYGALLGTAPTSPVSVSLQQGWNIIGVPSLSTINISSINVEINGSTTVPIGLAANDYNAVGTTLYSYSPSSNSYNAISLNGTLSPFMGYWIYARIPNLKLIIPTS